MTQPTPEQHTAITVHERPLVVEAGAGTGKTWVLVQRFLNLLDGHQDWPVDAIVAVTFTEKAAREMRDRLRSAVEERAAARPEPIWQTRRQALDTLRVSTIHSLCARILRENAIGAGMDPHFTVLDEQQALLLRAEAVRRTLTGLAHGGDPALGLLADLRVTDLENALNGLLAKRGSVQQLFARLPAPAQLLANWQAGLAQMQERLWARRLAKEPQIPDALDYLAMVPVPDPADALAGSVGLAREGYRLLQQGDYPGAVERFAQIDRRGGRAANWDGAEGKRMLVAMLGVLQAAGKALHGSMAVGIGPLDDLSASHLELWRALWQWLAEQYDRMKEEHQALDFDDLELRTLELLRQKGGPEPRLAAFLQGIRHLMVDEYQDTNPIQREIVYALAPPQMDADSTARLFVVGDPKQSIYRFRQAQVSIFNRTAQDVQAVTGYGPVPLSRSFRTHRELVNACNFLFDHILAPLDGRGYQDHEARPGPLQADRIRSGDPGLPASVELHLLAKQGAGGETINAADGRRWEADVLARRLLDLKECGYPVWDREAGEYRAFAFRDAAILFRSTTSLPLYEERFKAAGLPYLTLSGRGYYDRPEVQDLLALLALLHNPQDHLSAAAVLRSPLFGLSDETLYRLRLQDPAGSPAPEPRSLTAALADPPPTDQPDPVAHAGQTLEALRAQVGRTDVWQLLQDSIHRTGYLAGLALLDREGIGGGRRVANVQKLLALARDQDGATLADFLLRVQDLRAAEAREGEAQGREPTDGAVHLMSIHAAKGLEYPVVILADLGRDRSRSSTPPRLLHDPAFGLVCQIRDENGDWQKPGGYVWAEWLSGEMEDAEARRLLYVACTRAADLLVLSGRVGVAGSWMQTLLDVLAPEVGGGSGAPAEPSAEPRIQVVGAGEQAFRLAFHHPPPPGDEDGIPRPEMAAGPGLSTWPPLAGPIPMQAAPIPVSATQLARHLQREADPEADALPAVHPVVRSPGAAGEARVPGFRIGNLVHRALAAWRFPDLTPQELQDHLMGIARQVGMVTEADRAHGTARARAMLAALQRLPIFAEIAGARAVYREVPFALPAGQITLHGSLDLLFRDARGKWQLVDWKTEWVRPAAREVQAREHLPQIAAYARAVQQAIGALPESRIVFLARPATVYPFRQEELQAALALLPEGAPPPDSRHP